MEKWSVAATDEEKNKALKQLVDKIVYNREDNRVELVENPDENYLGLLENISEVPFLMVKYTYNKFL
jgi:hypothetical protein